MRQSVAAGKQSERQFVPLPTFALGLRDRDSTGQQTGKEVPSVQEFRSMSSLEQCLSHPPP